MNFKSYLKESRRFASVFYGQGCSTEHLKEKKRGCIKNLSHDSLIRLCFFVDSFQRFRPNALIIITLPKINVTDVKFVKAKMRSLLHSLSHATRDTPLFIWRIIFRNNAMQIKIITEIKISCDALSKACSLYWKNSVNDIQAAFQTFHITDENRDLYIMAFCTEDSDYQYPLGRWWGAINQSKHRRVKAKKQNKTSFEIKSHTERLKKIKNIKVKRGFYKK